MKARYFIYVHVLVKRKELVIIMETPDYIKQRRKRKRLYLRLRLGVLQLVHIPLLNLVWIPILAGTVFLWMEKDIALTLFEVPGLLFPIYRCAVMILMVLIPILCIIAVLDVIGERTARIDEAKLYVAFSAKELRNGCPVLMDKKNVKGNVTIREFYSDIPMKSWIDKRDEIADAMNCHFLEDLCYGGRSDGKRIVMVTAKGRKPVARGDLYDDEF